MLQRRGSARPCGGVALQQRVEIRRAELAALRLEQQGLTLTATIAGRVGLVEAHPGQVLLAGALVARVEAADARNVTVFLPEPVAAGSEAPEVVLLSRRGSPAKVAAADVVGYGRGVEELPVRLWRQPQVPEYGRTLIVRPPESLSLVPGEVLGEPCCFAKTVLVWASPANPGADTLYTR